MSANSRLLRPKVGLTCAFLPTASKPLANIQGRVIDVWPRFHSGDYLVTLEYATAVKLGKEFVTHIDGFMSELNCTIAARREDEGDAGEQADG